MEPGSGGGTSSLGMNSSPLPPSSEQLQIPRLSVLSLWLGTRCFTPWSLDAALREWYQCFSQQVVEWLSERMQRSLA